MASSSKYNRWNSPFDSSSKNNGSRYPKLRRGIILTAIVLLLIVGSATFLIPPLLSILPASAATVTITPASQHLSGTQTIDVVFGAPDPSQHQVAGRLVSSTTPSQEKTVSATGKGHQDATQARGTLVFSNPAQSVPNVTTQEISINGIMFETDAPFDLQVGQSVSVLAHAVNGGASGNVPAHIFDGIFTVYDQFNIPLTTVYGQNPNAFTGGQEAYDYTYVQQSDIDQAANPLVTQFIPGAKAAVQKQIHINEQLVNGIACLPNITSNHQAMDRVTDVTVTVSVNCKGEVYDAQVLRSMAAEVFKQNAASQLGLGYALVDDLVIGNPQVQTVNENGTTPFDVSSDGVWVFQFSLIQKHQLAQSIVGKKQIDAVALLLKQRGIRKVSTKNSGGWGNAMPTSPNDIKILILNVQGLQATT